MYALVEYKGKQYKAEKDVLIQVDKIDAEEGATIDIDTVLLVSDGDSISVGAPYVKGAKVRVVVENSIIQIQEQKRLSPNNWTPPAVHNGTC